MRTVAKKVCAFVTKEEMAKSVTVYTKDNCQPCKATKRWLDENEIPYEELHGPDHIDEIAEMGYMAAPVTVVTDDEGNVVHWQGFIRDNLINNLKAA